MNEDETLLDLELRLLIARHGRTRVSEALSAIGDVDVAGINTGIKRRDRGSDLGIITAQILGPANQSGTRV